MHGPCLHRRLTEAHLTEGATSTQGVRRQTSVRRPGSACPGEATTRRWCRWRIAEAEDYGESLAVIHDPGGSEVLHVEQHGIDFIPESERWATPRDIFGMWAGASVQIEYFIYGAILMTFGLTFAQVLFVIVLGNLSFFLLGLCSLQGPNAGTTVFAINRAPFGPNGSRPISFFNWITQIGFEVEGLILIVGAGLVLMIKAGYLPGDPAKVVLVIVAVLIQGILPFLGHAAIVKTLRLLVLPFVVLFADPARLRHPARPPRRRQVERRLAGLHRGARLHHRAQRARVDRERQRLHPLLPDRTPPRRPSWAGSSSARRCPRSSS